MSKMALGYGSEFHLLRFMGRHRQELESNLLYAIKGTTEVIDTTFDWLDFDYTDIAKVITGDKELLGLSFLKRYNIDWQKIHNEFKEEGSFINYQSWDAVFKYEETFYFVEAKAHVDELRNTSCKAKKRKEILNFMAKYLEPYGAIIDESWLNSYYQFANRLATIAFLNKHGIKAKLVYIFFINGFLNNSERRASKRSIDESKKEFEKAIYEEKQELGLLDVDLTQILINPIFIDASTKNTLR